MNILFYSHFQCAETAKGGTEKAVARVAKYLKENTGHKLLNAYFESQLSNYGPLTHFDVYVRLEDKETSGQVAEIIKEHDIDLIINEGYFFHQHIIEEAIDLSGRKVKKIFVHHFKPGVEGETLTAPALWRNLRRKGALRALVKLVGLPLYKLVNKKEYSKRYRFVYDANLRVVVSSKGNIEPFRTFAKIKDTAKFIAIPNILPDRAEVETTPKTKSVVIVSRLDESTKKISLALAAWKRLMDDEACVDWTLDIVGDGDDREKYRRYVEKHKIPNVVFHGWREDTGKFFARAAAILITSKQEGFCLSIVEAQREGCIPIAYDSFPALADLVGHGVNGLVVGNFGDVDSYVSELKRLLSEPALRRELAGRAMLSARQFESSQVGRKWVELLNNVQSSE